MEAPLFSLRFTIILGTLLFIPYAMSNETLEPYPAIILPSGAHKVNVNQGEVNIREVLLYGYDHQGQLQEIDIRKFLAPMPPNYIRGLAKREFGLSENATKMMKVRGIGTIEINDDVNPVHKKFAKQWLSNRLEKLDLSSDLLLVKYKTTKRNTNNGEEISVKIDHEKTLSLR